MNDQTSQPIGESNLLITDTAISYLKETAKWTNFLAIIGFIFIAGIALFAVFAGSMMSSLAMGPNDGTTSGMGFMFTLLYLLVGLIYFFPTWYLYQFSQKMKSAIETGNSETMNLALQKHKSFYKYCGIMTIVVLGLYVIGGLITLFLAF